MSVLKVWRPTVALAITMSLACTREPDPFEVDPDVVSVAVLLVAGEREARMLAAHPHRDHAAAAPAITATLKGPGWTATFSNEMELKACTRAGNLLGPTRCLRAVLPEPVQPGAEYGIRGTVPLGSFSGAAVVPARPLLLEPADTLLLSAPVGPGSIEIPVRFRAASGAGTLLAEILDFWRTEDDGTETGIEPSRLGYPRILDTDGSADTLPVPPREKPVRFSLRLLAIGWNYTNFLEHAGRFPLPQPWPSFGIEGEGIFGYFDGASPSRAVHIRVARPAQAAVEPGLPPPVLQVAYRYLTNSNSAEMRRTLK